MTKKEIFMKHATKLKGEYIMTEPSSMAAMEEYAQQQVNLISSNVPVIKSVCGNLHHFADIAHLGRCEECLETRKS